MSEVWLVTIVATVVTKESSLKHGKEGKQMKAAQMKLGHEEGRFQAQGVSKSPKEKHFCWDPSAS